MKPVSLGVAVCALLASLVACEGRTTSLMPAMESAVPAAQGFNRHIAAIDRAIDLGHRSARKPVSVVILLRYNHERELTQRLDALSHSRAPQYLTHAAFLARYAPTVEQEQAVLRTLRASGFTIEHTYANRTLIDVSAPTATVERVFATEIHDFRQRHGVRAANVRPLRIPQALRSFVADADANSVVSMRAALDDADAAFPPAPDATVNVIKNPSFATGKLSPWSSCTSGAKVPHPAISTVHPHTGKYDALAGTTSSQETEVNGSSAVCQLVTIPNKATLRVWSYQVTSDAHTKLVKQFGALYNQSGKLVKELFAFDRTKRWNEQSFDLSEYAGKTYYVAFGVVGTLKDKGEYIGQWVDDVSLVGTPVSPTPSPSPTPLLGPGGGWGPGWVTQGFDFPSIDGNSGSGQTIANVIDQPVAQSDITAYMQYFGLTQTGTVSTENSVDCGKAVSGSGSGSYYCGPDSNNSDVIEATLDVETIVGLAPAANVIVYLLPDGDLSNTMIEDVYNQIVSDGKATVVNSSFGGCENQDSNFDTMTDQIAQQAAVTGVTFSASSGDTGARCFNSAGTFPVGVSAPASDPHFVAVGGTQSNLVPGRSSVNNPQVWNDNVGAAGGGVSQVWSTPSNQSGISGVSSSGRNVPDIALPAANDDMYLQAYGGWGEIWGTSWASPIYVAMQAEINETCGAPAWGTTMLYTAFAKTKYQHDFIDVTSGSNAYNGAAGFTAAKGFDQASGIGMPLGTQIAIDNGCGSR